MSRENVEVVRRFMEAANEGDYGTCLDSLHPDVEWHSPPDIPNAEVALGREAYVVRWRDWLSAWERYEVTLDELCGR